MFESIKEMFFPKQSTDTLSQTKSTINKKIKLNETLVKYLNDLSFIKDIKDNKLLNEKQKQHLEKFEHNIFDIIAKHIEVSKGNAKIEVGVIGNFSSGKSLFINSLLEDNVCPIDQSPTTSSVTKFYFSPQEEILINDKISSREEYQKLVRHEGTGENTKVNYIKYGYPSIYFSNIVLYDSPGFENPSNKQDEQETLKLLEKVDAILYLVDINKGEISKKEIERLTKIKEEGKILFCILNKSDLKSPKAIEKIKAQIKQHNIFEEIIDYSSKNVFELLKDNELKKHFNDIETKKIPNQDEFELNIKAQKKQSRIKTIYTISINDKNIELPYIEYLKKKDKIINILNEIAMKNKIILNDSLKYDEIKHKDTFQKYIQELSNEIENQDIEIDMVNNFEQDITDVLNNLKLIEEMQICNSLQQAILESFKYCIQIKKVSEKEKSYFFSPYYKLHLNQNRFNKVFNEKALPLIEHYLSKVEEINNELENKYNFRFSFENAYELSSIICNYYLGEYYYKIGEDYSEDYEILYFANDEGAKDKKQKLINRIKNNIKLENDEEYARELAIGDEEFFQELMDEKLIFTNKLIKTNESAITQHTRVLSSNNNHEAQKQSLLKKLNSYKG